MTVHTPLTASRAPPHTVPPSTSPLSTSRQGLGSTNDPSSWASVSVAEFRVVRCRALRIAKVTPLVPLFTTRATTDALNIAALFASQDCGGKLIHNPPYGRVQFGRVGQHLHFLRSIPVENSLVQQMKHVQHPFLVTSGLTVLT